MIKNEQFTQTKDGKKWWICDASFGIEIIVPYTSGYDKVQDNYILLCNQVVENIKSIIAEINLQYGDELKHIGNIELAGIEILQNIDRHGADIILQFDHNGDGCLWLECGIQLLKTKYILIKWH